MTRIMIKTRTRGRGKAGKTGGMVTKTATVRVIREGIRARADRIGARVKAGIRIRVKAARTGIRVKADKGEARTGATIRVAPGAVIRAPVGAGVAAAREAVGVKWLKDGAIRV
jgi:hypothetical protein